MSGDSKGIIPLQISYLNPNKLCTQVNFYQYCQLFFFVFLLSHIGICIDYYGNLESQTKGHSFLYSFVLVKRSPTCERTTLAKGPRNFNYDTWKKVSSSMIHFAHFFLKPGQKIYNVVIVKEVFTIEPRNE